MVFSFNDTATTAIYSLSLHDALPICRGGERREVGLVLVHHAVDAEADAPDPCRPVGVAVDDVPRGDHERGRTRSEEHTSELQSHSDLVCRLLLEKKKKEVHRHLTTQG